MFRHNCNNFTNDFATFLLGKGIPEHITNMPQTVLESPFGQMIAPMMNQRIRAAKQQNNAILGIQQQGGQSHQSQTNQAASASSSVRTVQNMSELSGLLSQASSKCAVIFFTSASCPPCHAMYPIYEQLAAEVGDKAILIKADVGLAQDIGRHYMVTATPTFITFLHGQQQQRWSGADAVALRSNVQLLVQAAFPPHPHESLRLPTFAGQGGSARPVLYTKLPPLAKLLSKMGAAVADERAVQGVKQFVEASARDGPAEAHLPDMRELSAFLVRATGTDSPLPSDALFPLVDLVRCAMADPRFSGYLVEEDVEEPEKPITAILAILGVVDRLGADCPYALRLVTLQLACNLFSSPLAGERILSSSSDKGGTSLRRAVTRLISSSFLDSAHTSVRVVAASLMYNVCLANSRARRKSREYGTATAAAATAMLPEEDGIELAAAVLEAIAQETESAEALHGMLLALGYLVYLAPPDGELIDLLRTLDASATVLAKDTFKGEPLVDEVGRELLEKGLARP